MGFGGTSSITRSLVPFSDTAPFDLLGDSQSELVLLGEFPRDTDEFDDNLKGLGDEILVTSGGSCEGLGEGLGVLELKSLVMLFCFFKGFDAISTVPNGLDDRSWSSPLVVFIFESNARLLRVLSGGVEGVNVGSGPIVAVIHALGGSAYFPTHPVPQCLMMSKRSFSLRSDFCIFELCR